MERLQSRPKTILPYTDTNISFLARGANRDVVLKVTILKKLKRRGKWGGAHTSFDGLITGIQKHLKGETKNVAKDLIKSSLLFSKLTSYRLEISLNPKRRKETDTIIERYLPK